MKTNKMTQNELLKKIGYYRGIMYTLKAVGKHLEAELQMNTDHDDALKRIDLGGRLLGRIHMQSSFYKIESILHKEIIKETKELMAIAKDLKIDINPQNFN